MKNLDARGKPCPMPVVLTKQLLDAGEPAVTILVDNHAATENLTRLGEGLGCTVTVLAQGADFAVTLTQGTAHAQADPPARENTPRTGGWVLFVSREGIGEGNAELGDSLMNMFLYTLAQGGELPRRVLLMNGGVKLAARAGQTADHLNALTEAGCEVLVCGACLNFYGLTDALCAGRVSNMLELVDCMRQAEKVITL